MLLICKILVTGQQNTACISHFSGDTTKGSFHGDALVKTSAITLIHSKEDRSVPLLWFGVKNNNELTISLF